MYEVYNGLVVTAFKQDHGFVESMDRAFTRFVNENEITKLAKSASKSPQLLVYYCDQLLKKSAKNVEDDKMDEYLDQVVKKRVEHIEYYGTEDIKRKNNYLLS
jgi:cullin 1